jgi:hypothetical protein
MSAIRIIRPPRALAHPHHLAALTTRLYSSNVPANPPAPPGTLGNPTPESSVGKIIEPFTGGGYRSQGTSIPRTIRNIWKAGFKRAFWQIKEMNDTKVGTLIGLDRCVLLPQPWSRGNLVGRVGVLTVLDWGIGIMRRWENCLFANGGWNTPNRMSMTVLKLNLDGISSVCVASRE